MEDPVVSPSTEKILQIIERLRAPDGCPWDRKQTPQSLSVYLVEEVFELADAITAGDADGVCEELGDVFFQILFIGWLFRKQGAFDWEDVVRTNTEKMIRRHPHVYGSQSVDGPDGVREQWHRIKMAEKKNAPRKSLLDSIPAGLPALLRAYRICDRGARTNPDLNDRESTLQKAESQWQAFKAGAAEGDFPEGEAVLGSLLLSLVNLARLQKIHPHTALLGALKRFEECLRHTGNVETETGRFESPASDGSGL